MTRTGAGVIEHAESENNITANSTLTVNTTSADSYFNGFLRNGNYGSGSTGTLALVKNGSYKLTLAGRERRRLHRRIDRQRRHVGLQRQARFPPATTTTQRRHAEHRLARPSIGTFSIDRRHRSTGLAR